MNVSEIKRHVNAGIPVYWKQSNYVVIKDCNDKYLIKCTNNDHCIGLTWLDGVTLNGDESEFYINEDEALLILAHKDKKRVYNKMADKKYNCGDLL